MKKIVPILLAVALALALCLVGFADAESYDDDPLEAVALTNMGFRISLSSIPTILVVLPPTSIPITMPIIFLLISDSKIRVLIEN